jgi:hypothetical protein
MDGRRLITAWVAAVVMCVIVTIAPAIAQAEPPPLFYTNGQRLIGAPLPVMVTGKIKLESATLGEVHCLINFWVNAWNQHEHGEASNPERGYGEVTNWGTSLCEDPLIEAPGPEPGKRRTTTTVSPEMPLEEEFGKEAEVCSVETRTKLSECPNPSERKVGRTVSAVRRRPLSAGWKAELLRGQRGEREGTLLKVGLHEFGEPGQATAQNTACFPKEKVVNPETAKEEERPAKYTATPSGCVALDIIFPQIPLEYVFYGTLELFTVRGFTNGLHPSRLQFIEPGKLFSSEGGAGEGETTGEVNLFGSERLQLIWMK